MSIGTILCITAFFHLGFVGSLEVKLCFYQEKDIWNEDRYNLTWLTYQTDVSLVT